MKSLLIISFSNIAQDARVLKQVTEFSRDFKVITCGYGEKPEASSEHYSIPDALVYWRYDRVQLITRQYRRAYWGNAVVSWAKEQLESSYYDVIIADDLDTVPLALALNSRGVHADLHEYAPREKEDLMRWRLFVAPFRRWLCREYLPQCESITTVGRGLAQGYQREFGVEVGVVMNATPPQDLPVRPVGSPIRLVHSGACLRGRKLEVMLEAVVGTNTPVTFDLFLTPNDPGYLHELRERFSQFPNIRINDPVPYRDLVAKLSEFDVGVFVLPPTTYSYLWALPNKLFDFIQARLGVIVGPSPEMAQIVREHELGAIVGGFEVENLVRALDRLTPAHAGQWKQNSNRAADALSSTRQNAIWREYVEAIAEAPRNNEKPVDVIIACHNPERRLARAVSSVIDGSGNVASVTVVAHNVSAETLAETVDPSHRSQIKWLELSDGVSSPAGPFNHGIHSSTSEWVSIMGSDDFLDAGAVETWLDAASGADAVIAKVRYDDGKPMRTPPVRPLISRQRRSAVEDRLYYRSAPLGLMRNQFLKDKDLSMDPGLSSGEDLTMSTNLWSFGKVTVQRRGPGYRVGQDAGDRVTMKIPPIGDQLELADVIWNGETVEELSDKQKVALGTKFLRIHVFGVAYYRAKGAEWLPGDREELARKIQLILDAAPQCARPLCIADNRLLEALLDLSVPDEEVNRLAVGRRRFGKPSTLVTNDWTYLFHRDAPLRFIAASALVR